MTYNLYNVYKDGELVLENVRAGEASRFIGCPNNRIAGYAHSGDRLRGIYKIQIAEQVHEISGDLVKAFIQKYGMQNLLIWRNLNRKYGTRFRTG